MTRFTLATLATADGPRAAIGVGDAFHAIDDGETSPKGVREWLDDWDESFPILAGLAERVAEGRHPGRALVGTPLTPVRYPDKLLAVGANYSGHLREMGLAVEKWESMPFFLRPPRTTLVGPGDTVRIPRSTRQFDWEVELAVVVGRRLRHASAGEAAGAVAGYAVGLDLSCRDLIRVDNDLKIDLVRGKAQDTMAPCGPSMVPAAFVPDPHDLRLRLWVNDELMMDASSAEMLYRIDEQLAIISEFLTIEPGDILFTGSPAGSAGAHGDRFLRPGDRLRGEIERVGVLEVTCQAG